MFQCSSASRKFLNVLGRVGVPHYPPRFSALQRAENSSITADKQKPRQRRRFQCSSASRKFLNPRGFAHPFRHPHVSVLFSEPKIPQSASNALNQNAKSEVSVLFSEPKIPQSQTTRGSANSASRFQCSSASRKFLNSHSSVASGGTQRVSVLFSEPKIPQFSSQYTPEHPFCQGFSALQRAENSSILRADEVGDVDARVSVLFSEPKIPQSEDAAFRRGDPPAGFSALQRAENSSMR